MNLSNQQKRIAIIVCLFIFLITILIIIFNQDKVDITTSIHGIVNDNNVELIYNKNNVLKLPKGERVFVLEDDIINKKYKVKYDDKVGYINESSVSFYKFDDTQKYSLMLDVSEFNFKSENEFELFLLENKVNYVYIRIGGRGWGKNGILYLDDKSQTYIESCEYLGIPYGFYYLDEALNDSEVEEEIEFIKKFLDYNSTSMNVLPLAIDIEYQNGKGRADNIWDRRTDILNKLIKDFNDSNIECIVYVNGIRGEEYLKSLDTRFWVARYPENGLIPEIFYDYNMKYNSMEKILAEIIDSSGYVNRNIDMSKKYEIDYSDEFLNKVIGWQFSETGAPKDGINEKLDLSLVKNDFFKQYIK